MTESHYIGQELSIFAQAVNWKRYYSEHIRPYLTGDVLEVGAGLGVNTKFLKSENATSWTCLEPDPSLVAQMRAAFMKDSRLIDCRIETKTTESLSSELRFDVILYIDVLEHIENDHAELDRAVRLLRQNGRIIVLAPAHQWLYTSFDSAIGHYRRYNRRSLQALTPRGCRLIRLFYLDSIGMLASLINRICLRRPMPKTPEILLWDRGLIRLSRIIDKIALNLVGKSLLAVWQLERSGYGPVELQKRAEPTLQTLNQS
jgi:SAM-dependent methyltransferase